MRLHLVDGTFELFRAYFSKRPPHVTPDGRPFKATAGLVSSMLWLLADEKEAPTHVAVAFDNPIESFRNDLFGGYKTGAGIPADLASNFDAAEEACRALGLVVWSMDRWEADDALATAAHRWSADVDQVRILSPDKDLGQCLRGDKVVLVDRIREREITEASQREAKGIEPASVPDWLALVGDDADGIPGLPGWGDKAAATLLARYGHLDDIPDDPAAWDVKVRGADKLAATLRERRADAKLYRTLATLVTDVPLRESLDDLEHRGVPRERFLAWAEKNGLSRYADRVPRWRSES